MERRSSRLNGGGDSLSQLPPPSSTSSSQSRNNSQNSNNDTQMSKLTDTQSTIEIIKTVSPKKIKEKSNKSSKTSKRKNIKDSENHNQDDLNTNDEYTFQEEQIEIQQQQGSYIIGTDINDSTKLMDIPINLLAGASTGVADPISFIPENLLKPVRQLYILRR